MTLELAIHATGILLALAFLQQSAEHVCGAKDERLLFLPRAALSLLLLAGIYPPLVTLALFINALFILHRFQGPYNGGSDRMGLLILCCLCLVQFMPAAHGREVVFGYLALQLILSYFISGLVKIVNPDWRSGRALQDVFLFSAYPASENLRGWAQRPQTLRLAAWAVMLFELAFPLLFLTKVTLLIALVIAFSFHLANAYFFGLNRFVWTWLAAYPSILWLQERIFGVG
ncbi:MAG: HTTM domain-containing protein [Alphaproteobacteria bacterium]|nr:HTTM domain-containing protein [Alphaproteobacteria bacterium]